MANNIMVRCQCCVQQYPVRWAWYVCNGCGYRICTNCFGRHSGPYNSNGGYKCSQCFSGFFKWTNQV